MKYLLALLLAFSMPASADFMQLTTSPSYTHSDYLMKVRYKRKPRVVMYSYSWCPYCKQARQYFRANRIPYVEYDVERSRVAKRRFDALRGRVTPLLVVGRNRMHGFSVGHFRRFYRY